ncbi:complement C5-like [Pontoporia blainvillei]|uniref:Complement C5-like n=1 Tax=Pontoporia blainvillei TaxID=48723 RepID=A0ABX0S2Q7_PONBL|nr:complement C5-like [Pontoporia blainvillei]
MLDVNQETTDSESKQSVTRSSDGVASFVVNLPSEVMVLEFKVRTKDPDLPEENQASEDYRAIAYSSLSQSYLYIDWTENYKPLLVGEHLNIAVTPRSPYIDKITHYNYLILSKGKIVHFGTRDKLSYSDYQSINIPVTQNMVPSARLLVYYIVTGEQTAELVSDSVWLNIEEKCGNQLQVFQTLEKSDLGCGAGGGRNNADVFHLAGLTFLTNANADNSQENDEPCKEILRPKRTLQKKIEEEAAKYKFPKLKKCCYDGAHRNDDESCEERAARIKIGPRCVKAFKDCCDIASQFRAKESYKNIQLGRLRICVADTLKAKVFKNVFLEMNIPYSVVRGEQIQLSGTVYNYRTSGIEPEGVKRESYAGTTLDPKGIYDNLDSGSFVTFQSGK